MRILNSLDLLWYSTRLAKKFHLPLFSYFAAAKLMRQREQAIERRLFQPKT
jgi:hypothetical protein